MSFPLGYFKHFSNESVQKTWCPQAHEWGPAGTCSHPKPQEERDEVSEHLHQMAASHGLAWVGAKSGISSSEEETRGEGGWAPWGCLVPLPRSHTVKHQFHYQPVLPMSSLQQPSLLSLLLPNAFGQLDGVFFNCIWKFRGWGNLKNTSWNSDTQTAECLK